MCHISDPLWLLDCLAGSAWAFGGGCVDWEKQAISLAVALASGQEAAGVEGFLGSKGEGLSHKGWGILEQWQR